MSRGRFGASWREIERLHVVVTLPPPDRNLEPSPKTDSKPRQKTMPGYNTRAAGRA